MFARMWAFMFYWKQFSISLFESDMQKHRQCIANRNVIPEQMHRLTAERSAKAFLQVRIQFQFYTVSCQMARHGVGEKTVQMKNNTCTNKPPNSDDLIYQTPGLTVEFF